jgi:hypothetical protein
MFSYINYSIIFFKLWGLNKLLFGIPYYLVEHLIISNLLHIVWKGGKMVIVGIGSGLYYMKFPKHIEVIECPENNNIITDLQQKDVSDLDDRNNHLDMYKDTL